jgi:hypothetical protein
MGRIHALDGHFITGTFDGSNSNKLLDRFNDHLECIPYRHIHFHHCHRKDSPSFSPPKINELVGTSVFSYTMPKSMGPPKNIYGRQKIYKDPAPTPFLTTLIV